MYLKTQKFLILGVSKSGYAVAKYGLDKGVDIYLYEELKNSKIDKAISSLINDGAKFVLPENVDSYLDYIDVVVISPGVPINHAVAVKAKAKGKRIIGELEFGFLQFSPTYIGITGTNGKTTTATLMHHILKSVGVSSKLLGNVGVPLTSQINEVSREDVCVCEVSSFQLESVFSFTPHIACIINISKDHLERHYSMENYIYLKKRIFQNQRESEYTVLNFDDTTVKNFSSDTKGKVVWVSVKEKVNGAYRLNGKLYYFDDFIIDEKDLKIYGEHNICNVLFSICCSKLMGLKNEEIASSLKNFNGVKHRIEEVESFGGVTFYNDSKATNTSSTECAIDSVKKPMVLILGGSDKGEEYYQLFEKIKNSFLVKEVVLTGATRFKMLEHAGKVGYSNITVTQDFKMAIKIAYLLAKEGDAVLLSPAVASFDKFSGYEERGEEFIKIVKEIKFEKIGQVESN